MKKLSQNHLGFSLVEVTLALGITAFCLVAIFGLIPVGLNSNQTAIEQTTAASLATALADDLRATPKTNPPADEQSPRFLIPIPAAGNVSKTIFLREDGTAASRVGVDANPTSNPQYRATIFFVAPGNINQSAPTMARILITWPALADMKAAEMPSKFSGSFEAITAFDRN